MEDTISVIVPNYNNEKYINKCIESILGQTVLPHEIIIVDDCSTDGSRNIISNLAKMNELIKPIYLPQNAGVSNARNQGLKSAISKYVTFIDSDDFYYNEKKLENEIRLIKSKGNGIVAYSKTMWVEENGTEMEKSFVKNNALLSGRIYVPLLCGYRFNLVPRDFIIERKAILDIGGYNVNRSLYEDYELLLKIAKRYQVCCTYEFGTAYRQTHIGLSSCDEQKRYVEKKNVFNENIQGCGFASRFFYRLMRYILSKIK